MLTYSSSHDVYKLNDKAAYEACDFGSATLLGDTRDSPYSFAMDGSESTAYLGCSKGSHCSRTGQKVAVSLAGAISPPPIPPPEKPHRRECSHPPRPRAPPPTTGLNRDPVSGVGRALKAADTDPRPSERHLRTFDCGPATLFRVLAKL